MHHPFLRVLQTLGLIALLAHPFGAEAKPKKFAQFKFPSQGPSESIGGYASGCLAGAVEMPKKGIGYQMIRTKRHRYFTHSQTAAWLADYGKALKVQGLEVLVGDLSQPRGGLMSNRHKSHQTGLDLDVWFERPKVFNPETLSDPPSLVNRKTEEMAMRDGKLLFGERHLRLLKTAARSPEVDRIFVNWAIKRYLCQSLEGDREWLRKLRPWGGHDAHFHIRLHCPDSDVDCIGQPPIKPGTGCDEDLEWFSGPRKRERTRIAKEEAKKRAEEIALNPPKPKPPRKKPDPSRAELRCAELLQIPDKPPRKQSRK